jgi:hypothetical protein
MKDFRAELLMVEEREIDQFGKAWSTHRSLSLRILDSHGETTGSRAFDDLPGDIGPPALILAPDGGSLLLHFRCPQGPYVGTQWAVFAVRVDGALDEVARVSRLPSSESRVLRIESAHFLHAGTGATELRGRIAYSGDTLATDDTITATERFEHFTVSAAQGARVTDYSVRTKIIEKAIKVKRIAGKKALERFLRPSRSKGDPATGT